MQAVWGLWQRALQPAHLASVDSCRAVGAPAQTHSPLGGRPPLASFKTTEPRAVGAQGQLSEALLNKELKGLRA